MSKKSQEREAAIAQAESDLHEAQDRQERIKTELNHKQGILDQRRRELEDLEQSIAHVEEGSLDNKPEDMSDADFGVLQRAYTHTGGILTIRNARFEAENAERACSMAAQMLGQVDADQYSSIQSEVNYWSGVASVLADAVRILERYPNLQRINPAKRSSYEERVERSRGENDALQHEIACLHGELNQANLDANSANDALDSAKNAAKSFDFGGRFLSWLSSH